LPGEHYYDQIVLSRLPKERKKLIQYRNELADSLHKLKKTYMDEIDKNKSSL